MTVPSASAPFDTRALSEPVDRAAARTYVQELRRAGRAPARNTSALIVGTIVGVVFLTVFGIVSSAVITTFASIAGNDGLPWPLGVLFTVVPLAFFAVFAVIAVVMAVRLFGGAANVRWYRLDRFAWANGMTWYPRAKDPPLPGMIFGLGHSRVATDVVRGDRPRLVEFANYRYKTGSGKNESTHSWGYVAVKLSSPLPHIVLDAVGNNALFGSNLPASFDRDQRLSLEGEFDRHFALYCPRGYERDALYLFTPDVMARFIDSAAALDVEIIDDWLFLYTKRDVSTLDPATWAWLFSVVGALLDKLGQWERWRDDRLPATDAVFTAAAEPFAAPFAALPFAAPSGALRPPPGVARGGRRLTQRFPWAAFVLVAALIGAWLLSQFGVFAGILSSLFTR